MLSVGTGKAKRMQLHVLMVQGFSTFKLVCGLRTTTPVPSAAPLKTCSPDPSPASLLFSGHAPATHCPSCSEGPKTDHSTRGLNTGHVSSVAARATLTARGRNKEANSASQGMSHCHHFTCHLRTTVPRPSPEDR